AGAARTVTAADAAADLSPESPATPEDYERAAAEVDAAFASGDLPRVVRLLDQHFAHAAYSLQSLLGDEQGGVLERLLAGALGGVEDQLREIFRQHAPLMRLLGGMGTPLPAAFRAIADFMVAADLRRALADPEADPRLLEQRLEEAGQLGMTLDA